MGEADWNPAGLQSPALTTVPHCLSWVTVPTLRGQCQGTRFGPLAKKTPESCFPDCVTHQLEDPWVDFPQKFPELGKEAIKISETTPCFSGWGQNGHHPGQIGAGLVPEAASSWHLSLQRNRPHEANSTRDEGPGRTERLPGAQLSPGDRGDGEDAAGRPPCIAN